MEDDLVPLDDFVHTGDGNGQQAVVQPLNPAFLPQVPQMKFQVRGRTSQQPFHLDEAAAAKTA